VQKCFWSFGVALFTNLQNFLGAVVVGQVKEEGRQRRQRLTSLFGPGEKKPQKSRITISFFLFFPMATTP